MTGWMFANETRSEQVELPCTHTHLCTYTYIRMGGIHMRTTHLIPSRYLDTQPAMQYRQLEVPQRAAHPQQKY